MERDDFSRRLRRQEDRETIRDLHARYCFVQDRGHQCHDERDVQEFLRLCHPDIVWDNSPDGSRAHRGHAAVAAYLRQLWPRFAGCMHFVHNLVVTFDSDDRARGRASFEAVGDMEGVPFVAAGYYEDEYARSGEGWVFLLHREVPFYFVRSATDWSGPKPRVMPEWTRPR